MSESVTQLFRRSILFVALLNIHGAVLAQDAEVVELTSPESSVSAGIGNWSGDRHQQGIYDGMRDKGAYGLLDFKLMNRDNATGTWTKFEGQGLGLDVRKIRGEWLRQGDVGGYIEYDQIQRDNLFTFNTGLDGIGTTMQTTSVVTTLGSGNNVDLKTRRDQISAGFYKQLRPDLGLRVSFKNEEKNGNRHWSRGGRAEFLVEPIDSTTQQLEATLSYNTNKLQVNGGYYGSFYTNANSLVTSCAVTCLPLGSSSTYYLSLPLDNQAHQLFLNGGYNLTPTTRASFRLEYALATQNEHLATQDIPGLSLPGSPDSLNGKLVTTLAQFGLTARPTRDLTLKADLRHHDQTDKTPVAMFVNTTSGTTVHNTPYDLTKTSGKLEANYRLAGGLALIGGLDLVRQDRSVPIGRFDAGVDQERWVPFRSKLNEDTWRVQLRKSMSETVNGSIAFLRSDRTGSSYTRTEDIFSDQINPIHIADRQRDKLRMMVDWTPTDRLSLQVNMEHRQDDYGFSADRPYGIRDGSGSLFAVDGSYALSDAWKLTAWYAYDKTTAAEYGLRAAGRSSSLGKDEKVADLSDTGNALGFGLRGKVASRFSVGTDLEYMRSLSKYPQSITLIDGTSLFPTSSGVTVEPLPDITNRIVKLKFFAEYALNKKSGLRFDLIHERWNTNDWSWQFADRSTFQYADGTSVTSSPRFNVTYLGVRYQYKFQ